MCFTECVFLDSAAVFHTEMGRELHHSITELLFCAEISEMCAIESSVAMLEEAKGARGEADCGTGKVELCRYRLLSHYYISEILILECIFVVF